MLSALRGVMKTSHPSIQKNISFIFSLVSYFGSCQQPRHPAKLDPNPQMLQCMYIHLPGVGGGEGPKTNRSTKKKKKTGQNRQKEQSGRGRPSVQKVPLEPCVFVGILHLSLKERHLATLKAPSLWGKEQKQVIMKVTFCLLLLGFFLVLSVEVVLPLPLKKSR